MNQQQPTKTAVIYLRTAEPADRATTAASLERQQRVCVDAAQAFDLQVVGTYRDVGHSGHTADRPGLARLLRDIRREPVSTVIVASPDRLARSLQMSAQIERDITQRGATVMNGLTGGAVSPSALLHRIIRHGSPRHQPSRTARGVRT